MNAIAIKKAFMDRDLTAAAVARDLGVSRKMVSAVVNHRRETPYVRRAIAAAIGKTYKDVWGEDDPGVDRLPVGRPRKCVDSGTHSESDVPASPIENKAIAGGIN